jgi:hypothetical protein
MAADPFAFDPLTELLARSRALQRATAAAIADTRAAFSLAREQRAHVRAQIAQLRLEDGCPGVA